MERLIERRLLEWKGSPDRKPLVMLGIRQCGKTYILREFGERHYSKVAYFDFESMSELRGLFWNLDVRRIVEDLSRRSGVDIDGDTLIIFDEVQMCYPALTSLKYFLQDAPEYHIACAGSLLGLALADRRDGEDGPSHTFPVGKVDFIRLRPMCFGEFVIARMGRRTFDYLDSLGPHDTIPDDLMRLLESAYMEYLLVGGMPEAVETWCRTNRIADVRRVQGNIIASYERDMGKYSGQSYARISGIWESAAYQLAEAGDRFRMKEAGGYTGTLADPISWLLGADMLRRAWEVNDDRVPPNPRGGIYFKLYFPDVGLLTCKAGLDYDTIVSKDGRTSCIRGSIAENFVLNELDYALDRDGDAYYWENASGRAEVDFQVVLGGEAVPVEVKSGKVGRIRSLEVYVERYSPKAAFVVSRNNVRIGGEGEYTFVPLYMAWKFGMYAEAAGLRTTPSEPPPLGSWEPPEADGQDSE